MTRLLTIAALLLVSGCGQPGNSNNATSSSATSNDAAAAPRTEPATPAVPSLNGEWQVAKLDGRPAGPGSHVTATFAGGKVRFLAGCTRRAWTFTQKRNIISLASDSAGSANCETPPSVEQEAMIHALDRATMAIFDQEGREASLSGNGGNVTLVRR
jgi:hypothetical protein